jgi:hypothetical protein
MEMIDNTPEWFNQVIQLQQNIRVAQRAMIYNPYWSIRLPDAHFSMLFSLVLLLPLFLIKS